MNVSSPDLFQTPDNTVTDTEPKLGIGLGFHKKPVRTPEPENLSWDAGESERGRAGEREVGREGGTRERAREGERERERGRERGRDERREGGREAITFSSPDLF